MREFIDWLSHNISNMEAAFMQSMADLQRAAIIIRETEGFDEADLQYVLQSALSTSAELRKLGEAALSSGEAIPKIESLGENWEINRRMYQAITKDFAEFLNASVNTISEIETYLDQSA